MIKFRFAAYFEFVGVDAVSQTNAFHYLVKLQNDFVFISQLDASLQAVKRFTVEKTQVVLTLDALTTSNPMSAIVNKRNEINEHFNAITYSKGIYNCCLM